ncbi:MAG: hypothetical protein FJ291_23655 [Planctomycetes bacterium]|nr:hypothetical protein [Planctomycetota bacterium]
MAGVKLWVEAEAYAEQSGSTAPKYAMKGASGGLIVDNDWGGRATDFLRYRIELPADIPRLHLALRYARAMAGEAVVRLVLDGDAARAVALSLPSTGGWGFQESEWELAEAVLPAAKRGPHTLEIRSTRDRNNVNTDGFFLSDRPIPRRKPATAETDAAALRARVESLRDGRRRRQHPPRDGEPRSRQLPQRAQRRPRGLHPLGVQRPLGHPPIRDEFYWRGLSAQYQYPWPLSEHFFLVSCQPKGKRHFGIYLIDTFGNRTLAYEDPSISCSSPMLLAPRPRPPVIPSQVD